MIDFFIIFIFSIVFHELGHLLVALYWKVNVYSCSIGFGKILLHKKWKGIDWRISLIPLGGYCNIEERLNHPFSLNSIPYWKQMSIVLAGAIVNFIIACVCYLINYGSIKIGIYIDLCLIRGILFNNYDYFYLISPYIKNVNMFLLQCEILNLTLVIGNLIPLPALDGGYIWLLPLRKKLSDKLYKNIIIIGFILAILIQLILIYLVYYK